MLNRHSGVSFLMGICAFGKHTSWQINSLSFRKLKKCNGVIHAKDLFKSGRVIWLMAKRTYTSFSLEFDQIDSESSHELDSHIKFPALL